MPLPPHLSTISFLLHPNPTSLFTDVLVKRFKKNKPARSRPDSHSRITSQTSQKTEVAKNVCMFTEDAKPVITHPLVFWYLHIREISLPFSPECMNRFCEDSSGVCMVGSRHPHYMDKIKSEKLYSSEESAATPASATIYSRLWFLGTFPTLSLIAFKARTISFVLQLKEIHYISASWNVEWE